MADFTESYVGGPPQAATSTPQPTRDNSGAALFEFAGNAVESLGNFALQTNAIKIEKQKEQEAKAQQARQDQAITDFSRSQLKLVDATETGDISSTEARMRMRANLSAAMANNPALSVELAKAHTATIKSTGLGDVVYEGTEEEQQTKRIETAALDAGWLKPGMSKAQKAQSVEAYMGWIDAQRQMDDQKKRLDLQKAKVTLSTASINQQTAKFTLQEKQLKAASQGAVGQATQAFSVKFANDLEEIRRNKESGIMTPEQAIMAANQKYMEVNNFVTQNFAAAGSDYLSNQLSGVKMLHDNYSGYLSGKTQAESLDNHNKIAEALQVQTMLGDPKLAQLAAASKVFKNSDLILKNEVSHELTRYLTTNSTADTKPADPFPDYDADKFALNDYLGMVNDGMRKVNNGTAVEAEATRADINTNMTNVLNGIDVYSPTAEPAAYAPILNFLSSTDVGKFAQGQGGWSDSAAAQRAANVLNYQYETTLIPMIQKEWSKSKVTSYNVKPTTDYKNPDVTVKDIGKTKDIIKPVFMGSGVTFVAEPGITDSFTRLKVKELNKNVAEVLNKMIRAQAHLNGTTDYKAVYEQSYEQQVFGDLAAEEGNAE